MSSSTENVFVLPSRSGTDRSRERNGIDVDAGDETHVTYMYPPPHMTYMYPPPHMTYDVDAGDGTHVDAGDGGSSTGSLRFVTRSTFVAPVYRFNSEEPRFRKEASPGLARCTPSSSPMGALRDEKEETGTSASYSCNAPPPRGARSALPSASARGGRGGAGGGGAGAGYVPEDKHNEICNGGGSGGGGGGARSLNPHGERTGGAFSTGSGGITAPNHPSWRFGLWSNRERMHSPSENTFYSSLTPRMRLQNSMHRLQAALSEPLTPSPTNLGVEEDDTHTAEMVQPRG